MVNGEFVREIVTVKLYNPREGYVELVEYPADLLSLEDFQEECKIVRNDRRWLSSGFYTYRGEPVKILETDAETVEAILGVSARKAVMYQTYRNGVDLTRLIPVFTTAGEMHVLITELVEVSEEAYHRLMKRKRASQ
jgi:hypothetical protein